MDTRWWDDPVESGPSAGFGVYLHVPFCTHRCGYCDFATVATDAPTADGGTAADLVGRYVPALVADLARQVAAGPDAHGAQDAPSRSAWPVVTSVFVGGGTPTLLGAADLTRLLDAVRGELEVAADAEITVECNPETASVGLFGALVEAGVTRISLGAQSFSAPVLRTLERGHDPAAPLRAVVAAREAGVPRVSLDLIYGTPGERDEDWTDTLTTALAAGTDHLSAYALTVHDGTSFGARVRAGSLAPPDDDVQRRRFDVARDVLSRHGWDHYELSNWARTPGARSAHNVLYWRHGEYLAAGVGAHAHVGGRRTWQHRSLRRWFDAVEDARPATAGAEVTDVAERALERLLLGLRLRAGLHPRDVPTVSPAALQDAVDAGLLTTSCGRLQATDDGWFLLDEAVTRLLAEPASRPAPRPAPRASA